MKLKSKLLALSLMAFGTVTMAAPFNDGLFGSWLLFLNNTLDAGGLTDGQVGAINKQLELYDKDPKSFSKDILNTANGVKGLEKEFAEPGDVLDQIDLAAGLIEAAMVGPSIQALAAASSGGLSTLIKVTNKSNRLSNKILKHQENGKPQSKVLKALGKKQKFNEKTIKKFGGGS